ATVISAGTLAFNSATAQALAATISGAGALRQSGSGSLVLSGNNSYTGGTTLAAGSIQALHTKALGNGALTLSSGTLALGNATNTISLTGITDLAWSSSNAVVSLSRGGNITASGNFTNGGNAGNRTFDLGSGKYLQIGNNTLVSFGNTTFNATAFLASFSANHSHNGSFQIVGNSLVYTLTNGTATGNIIDNWAGPDTPTWVDFSVNGANGTVYSVVSAGESENTIDGLIFSNTGNLVIQQNTVLNVTGGGLNVVNGTSLVTGGNLATPGSFNKTGAGELDVQNNIIVGGTASIDAGLLSVNGQLNANTVVVNTGGTLGGNGTIVAPGGMTIAGTLSPGNSPGVISIVSNPVWTSTATTLLEIASPSNYDRIVVSGTAQVAGTLNIVNFGGNDSLAYGQQYPFLTATGGISGDFATITAPATFRGRFLNQGNTGTILIAPDTYTRVAVTPNQRNVAKALDSFIPAKNGDRMAVSTALDLQTAAQYPAAFNAIMPGFYESLPDIVIEQAYNETQLLNQRLSSVRLGAQGFQYIGMREQPLKNDKDGKSTADAKDMAPIRQGPSSTNWNAWVMGTGEFSNARGGSSPNYNNSAGGFLVGADYRLSQNFSSGLFAGYQYNYAKYNGGGSTRGNSALFGLYGSYKNEDGYYADTVIGGGYNGFQTRRPIKFSTINRIARANPNTGQFNAAINFGKDWTIDKFIVGPLLGLQYTYAGTPGFTEQGAGSLDLAVGSQNTSSLRSSLGARIAYVWDISDGIKLIPEIRAQWMHEFLNNGQTLTSSLDGGGGPSFGYQTMDAYQDSLFGGVGVTTRIGERWSGSLFYNVNFGNNDFSNNIISADLNFAF
ncbi:MAG: autotransporter domain-containing protein, partial [Spartobacteria bacterium]